MKIICAGTLLPSKDLRGKGPAALDKTGEKPDITADNKPLSFAR